MMTDAAATEVIREHKTAKKDAAVEIMARTIQHFELQDHMSRWARTHLVRGVADLHNGHYVLAEHSAHLAMVPDEKRIPDEELPADFDEVTVEKIKQEFEVAKDAPLILFARF